MTYTFPFFSFFYYFSFSIRLRHMELCVVQIMDKIFHFLWWHMWAWVCERMATHFYLGSFSSAWTITMMWLFLYHLFVDSFLLNIFYGLRWWCHHYFIFLLVWNSVFLQPIQLTSNEYKSTSIFDYLVKGIDFAWISFKRENKWIGWSNGMQIIWFIFFAECYLLSLVHSRQLWIINEHSFI